MRLEPDWNPLIVTFNGHDISAPIPSISIYDLGQTANTKTVLLKDIL